MQRRSMRRGAFASYLRIHCCPVINQGTRGGGSVAVVSLTAGATRPSPYLATAKSGR